jgi:2-iminoacetate synthase ThiH
MMQEDYSVPDSSTEIVLEILGESQKRRLTGGELMLLLEEAALYDLEVAASKLERGIVDYSSLQNRVDDTQITPDDVYCSAEETGVTTLEVLKKIQADGLELLSGDGAEILNDRVRTILVPDKTKAREWIEICEEAHFAGLKTIATMTFGNIETYYERVEHLLRLRESQDKTGGYVGFIPIKSDDQNDYLRMTAIAKIGLDNFPA